MLGAPVFRSALYGPWSGNALWTAARAVPSLDLCFADIKSLSCAATGQNLVTFTRASSGTYVDSQGVIRTATTNLLLRSEELDSGWTGSESNTTVTANTSTAPNGTITADTINFTNALSFRYQSVSNTPAGTTYTFSVWLASGTKTQTVIRIAGSSTGTGGQFVVNLTPTLTRYSVTVTIPSGNTGAFVGFENRAAVGGGDESTGTIIVWGAQLEQSSTVSEYIPTTSTINSAPRFDHNPTTGESLGLLVEEQRTNLVTSSATFQPSSGGNPASYTVDQVAPDGTTTASRQTAANPRTFVDYQGIANAQYTFSVYAKAASGTVTITLQLKNAASDTVIATGSNVTLTTAWQRLTVTGTTNGATTGARIEVIGPVVGAPAGAVFWGAQLEAGSFSTSYIPTTTATVTRSADVASITGANFSSWYNQTEGTVFWEGNPFASTETGYFGVQDAGSTSFVRLSRSFNQARNIVLVSSVNQADLYSGNTVALGANNKLATAIKANDFALSLAGATVVTDTSGTMPTVDRATIGTGAFLNQLNGTIRRLAYWPQRLANSTLQAITQ